MGVMLALPLAAMVKVFAAHGIRRYQTSALFGASPTSSSPRPLAPARVRPRRRRATRGRARAFR
jgi:hypothetical protein